eukprot:CAMPEP_0119205706 /NCGR_PEP_ID=MMETSP1316-20130426/40019_1 /TAXON_ID=41880 /ORGANISM="Pycnococcus provasolii, Strain RCC2336" /LENGTH=100 /DNA_ID=CAMNT_0007202095 /DNA_START=923 /DNA_END=1221 /DNA_ORIENTATION=-
MLTVLGEADTCREVRVEDVSRHARCKLGVRERLGGALRRHGVVAEVPQRAIHACISRGHILRPFVVVAQDTHVLSQARRARGVVLRALHQVDAVDVFHVV